ncbi:hypothetical protein PMN64_27045 [Bradyrhizobium sp. UFLA01-814]|uniref:AbiTii domain-containing protein n=1 Tax=Bradyrhizobium sp. UFLA01-814 TaxID=3023480 RepID=UPI00398ACF11
MQLLDEIIEGAVDDKIPLPSLLRKCLLLAHQLKNAKLKAWVEYELNGYPGEEALPEYRKVGVHATGTFMTRGGQTINNQPLAATVLSEEHRHWAETAPLMQPIAAYDIGKDAEGKPNSARMPWPAELVALYADKFAQGWTLIRASQQVPGTIFVSVLDNVRTRILQLALGLKEELGDEMTDATKLPKASVDQSVVNHIYGGNVVVAATAENFSQVQNISVVQNDLPSLLKAMEELGLHPTDVKSLSKAVQADAKAGATTIGQKTSEWLKELPVSLGKGTLKVGFEAAKSLATKYVLAYFGLGG